MTNQSNAPNWAEVMPSSGQRRLPIYLMLDSSSSMKGSKIESIQRGIERLKREVSEDPFARDVAHIAVITFASDARMLTDGLVPITQFPTIKLTAQGVTRLDLGFTQLTTSIDSHVLRPVLGGQKGDWRPIVFVLTDGQPTDERGARTNQLWMPVRDALVRRPHGTIKPQLIVAAGTDDADNDTLKAIAFTQPRSGQQSAPIYAFRILDRAESFAALFDYVTQSIINTVQVGSNPVDPQADVAYSPDLIRIP
ncbi:VWA domain-containing protein [Chloroflexales bacterium ZM16-3]|nr:VWA domain-containing protein [Chloroflexales bacterium ZM16-3]